MNDDSCRTRAISRRVLVFFTDVTGGKWGIICRHLVFVQQGANSAAQSIHVAVCRVCFAGFSSFPQGLPACASSIHASSFSEQDIDRRLEKHEKKVIVRQKMSLFFSRRVKITYELCERKLSAKLSHFRRYNPIKLPGSLVQLLINNCPRKCTPVNVRIYIWPVHFNAPQYRVRRRGDRRDNVPLNTGKPAN